MTKQQVKSIIEKVVWTFLQAAAGVLVVTNQPTTKAALVAAFAAGVSAVKNIVKESVQK